MIEFKKPAIAGAILLCALSSSVVAQEKTAPPASRNTTDSAGAKPDAQTKNGEQTKSKKEQPQESGGLPGRRGVSCQRNIPYKGEDGKMHLCN